MIEIEPDYIDTKPKGKPRDPNVPVEWFLFYYVRRARQLLRFTKIITGKTVDECAKKLIAFTDRAGSRVLSRREAKERLAEYNRALAVRRN